jgi:hypothetical protein
MAPITSENGGNEVAIICHPVWSDPPEARKAFKRASRFQVRNNVPITITDWWQVLVIIKEKIWSNMKEKSSFQLVQRTL